MKLIELFRVTEDFNLHDATVLAQQAHENDTYAGKSYYDGHLLPVIKQTKKLGGNETHQMVAALHDTVEDGRLSLALIKQKYGGEVAEAIDAISRRQGETYFEYVQRAIQNPIARVVKKADLMVNLSNNRPESLKKRYERALTMVD